MSKIIKETGWREFSTVVETTDGKQYLVSSADTFDAGFETMVFEWSKTHDTVESWSELFCTHYATYDEMRQVHEIICKNLEEVLNGNV